MSINRLIKKYEKRVPGEMYSREYERERKRKQSQAKKHRIVDEVGALMFLRKTEMTTVHYLVDKFRNFRSLHGKCSTETIICAFCFTLVRLRKPSARLSDYKASSMYNLSEDILTTIQTKIIGELLANSPVKPKDSCKYDNNILVRSSLKQAETTKLKED